VSANATNNVAMWLGAFASTGSFRSEIDVPRPTLVKMLAASVIGSIIGAFILLRTSNAQFSRLIPFLLLGSTTLFVCGPWITKRVRRIDGELSIESPLGLGLQFCIAVYGGFFGAAAGILMLALLTILGMTDLRRANAFKVLLSTVINGVAVIPFVIARAVAPEPAVAMSIGAIAGGFLGAGVVKRMPPKVVRGFVIVVASTMTVYFFWKQYVARA
jgi:uncharacterized membrane protein YfcA